VKPGTWYDYFTQEPTDGTRHFQWQGPTIEGTASIGRATVVVLNMNDADYVKTRQDLILDGVFPVSG
jgi:hypothetical protein